MIITLIIIYVISSVTVATVCYLATKDNGGLTESDKITLAMALLPLVGTIMVIAMIVYYVKELHKEKIQKKYNNDIYRILYTKQ